MKTVLSLGLILAATLSASPVAAQDAAQDAAAAQAAFLDYLKLAPEHAYLKQHVGKWTTEMKTYFEGPDNPTIAKGEATFKLLMDGRYAQQDFKGTYGGMPFVGRGLTGYDKNKKKYIGSWIDNFETGISITEGTYDEKTKTMTEYGTMHTAEGETKMKNVVQDIDDDTLLFKMYMILPDGKETLSMDITYRRVK